MTWSRKLSVVKQWVLSWITIFMILWFNSEFLWNDSLLRSCHWHIQSFFGQTGIYLEPPWLALSEIFFKNCASRCSKNAHTPALLFLGFLCMQKKFFKLLKFTLWNTPLRGWFFKKSYIHIVKFTSKNCMAINLWELKSDLRKYCK